LQEGSTYIINISNGYISTSNPNKKTKTYSSGGSSSKTTDEDKGKKKSNTTGFSGNSRNGLMKALNSMKPEPLVFVSLTYPPELEPQNGMILKRHKSNLSKLIRTKFPASWFFWRLEFQKDSCTPHYHLLGTNHPDLSIDDFSKWINEKWSNTIHADPTRREFITEAKEIKETDLKRIKLYFSKEEINQTKISTKWKNSGLRWGRMNIDNMHPKLDTYEIDKETLIKIKDIIKNDLRNEVETLQSKLDKCTEGTDRRYKFNLSRSIQTKKDYASAINRRDELLYIQYSADCIKEIEGLLKSKLNN